MKGSNQLWFEQPVGSRFTAIKKAFLAVPLAVLMGAPLALVAASPASAAPLDPGNRAATKQAEKPPYTGPVPGDRAATKQAEKPPYTGPPPVDRTKAKEQTTAENAEAAANRKAAAANTGPVKLETKNIEQLSNWLMWLALLACMIGMFIAAALWALGSKGQNPGQELTGKKGFILCCTAAFFVGALPGMLNFLNEKAVQSDTTNVTGKSSGPIVQSQRGATAAETINQSGSAWKGSPCTQTQRNNGGC